MGYLILPGQVARTESKKMKLIWKETQGKLTRLLGLRRSPSGQSEFAIEGNCER